MGAAKIIQSRAQSSVLCCLRREKDTKNSSVTWQSVKRKLQRRKKNNGEKHFNVNCTNTGNVRENKKRERGGNCRQYYVPIPDKFRKLKSEINTMQIRPRGGAGGDNIIMKAINGGET